MNVIVSSSFMGQHTGVTMEYDEDEAVTGCIPEFGAIFMSNLLTKKECFKRKIFGLPSSQAEFVKQIKAGMVLFLFEFKKRQLFGVYQASSNGAIDIVPHAFNYSGRRFPAQVRFTPIWDCDPLSERQFHDAIRENYFSAKKFKFGLSEIQVHRLLALFSSRKMKNKIIPRPMAEAVVGVAGTMDRRSVGDARFELSGRGCTKPTVIDEYNPDAFSDYHANKLVKEDEVFTYDRVNNEGKVYPLAQGDFLAKRRRLYNADMLLADDMTHSYNHSGLQTNRINSSRDSLDEVSSLAAVRQLLAVERVRKENLVNKIRNEVLSSEYVMDPLDVRTTDEDRFIQRNRFFDEYNRDNGFTLECYEKPLDTGKHVLFDDNVQRNQNIDDNLSLHRQAMQAMEDHQCSLNEKAEENCDFDFNVSPFSAFEHHAGLLHDIRKTNSVRRFPVNDPIDGKPNFGACSVENPSLTKFSQPLHYRHRIVHDMKYPIMEGRVTENIVASSTRNAGSFENFGGQVADNGRFRQSEGVDNENDFHTYIAHGSSLVCPSSFAQKGSSSSFSARFLPEKGPQNFGPPHATSDDATITRTTPYIPEYPKVSHEFNVSMAAYQNPTLVPRNSHRSSMEDIYTYKNRSSPYILNSKKSSIPPDITPELRNQGLATNVSGHQSSLRHEATSSFLDIPYIPEHAKISHEYNVSMTANQNPSLVRENPHCGSTEDFYPYKNRSSPYILESQKSTRSPDIAPELRNKDLVTNVSGHPSSLRHEATSSFLNSDFSMHMDQSTTVPVNDRCSLSSKSFHAQPATTDRENIGGEFAYNSKSSGDHFSFDDNFPTESLHMNKHVPQPEMDVLAVKDFICSEAKYSASGTYHLECNLAGFENRNIGISNKNMNCRANHENSEAPHFDSKINRKSVFSRLASREEFGGDEESNGSDLDCHGRYMDATADEVMEMLRQSNNLSSKKIKKSRVSEQPNHNSRAIRQPNHGERTSSEKHVQSHSEIKLSTTEKKISKDAHLAIEESIEEMPKETRIMDFKRRSYTNKNLVGSCIDSSKCNKLGDATAEVEKPMKTTLKRKRLVRPVFGKTESATDVISGSQNSRPLIPIPENNFNQDGEKSISICEVEMPKDNTRLNELVWSTHLSMDRSIQEHSSPQKQKNIKFHVLPSSKLKEHKTSILGVHNDSSQGLVEIHSPSMDSNINENSSPEEQKNIKFHVLPSSSNEIKELETSIVGVNIDTSQALANIHSPSMDYNMKEHLIPEGRKDIAVHVLPSLSNEHKEHKTSIVGHIDSLRALLTEVHKPSMDCNIKELSSLVEQKDIQVHVLSSPSNEPIEHKPSILGPHIDRSQGLLPEITLQKGVAIQTSVEDILNKNVDLTAGSLNLEETSPVGLEIGVGCLYNPIKEKRPRMVKRKSKVKKKANKKGIEPSQC